MKKMKGAFSGKRLVLESFAKNGSAKLSIVLYYLV